MCLSNDKNILETLTITMQDYVNSERRDAPVLGASRAPQLIVVRIG